MKGEKVRAWDRLPGESVKAYSAFKIYLEMPDRSLQKVVERLTISRQAVSKWANKFNWVERAANYDSSIVEEERKARARLRQEELKKQHKLGMLMAEKAVQGLMALEIKKMTPYALVQMADVACKILNTVSELESSADAAFKVDSIKIVKAGDENAGR